MIHLRQSGFSSPANEWILSFLKDKEMTLS